MSEELKPCPFCGNSAILHSRVYPDERQIFYVQCDTFKPGWCGAMVSEKPEGGGLFHERAEAVAAWNRRPLLSSSRVEEVRRMREALEFYADCRRYDGPNQRNVSGDPYTPADAAYMTDVTRDGGSLARIALSLQVG